MSVIKVHRHVHCRVITLRAHGVVAATLLLGRTFAYIVYPTAVVWGLTFGGAATLLQTASADTAGADADLAQSMIVTVWNAAIAGGGIIGGITVARYRTDFLPPAVLLLSLIAAAVAQTACPAGFVRGPRAVVRS